MQVFSGTLIPSPRFFPLGGKTGSFFTARVASYDPVHSTAIVLVDRRPVQVATEFPLKPGELLRLQATREDNRWLWKVLAPLTEQSSLANLPPAWVQAFVQLGLPPHPERIALRMARFGRTPGAAEWGAQAEARRWPDTPNFIAAWSHFEALLEQDPDRALQKPFLEPTPQERDEVTAWNQGSTAKGGWSLYPVPFRWQGQKGCLWVKSRQVQGRIESSWVTWSLGVPLRLFVGSSVNLTFFRPEDEVLFQKHGTFVSKVVSLASQYGLKAQLGSRLSPPATGPRGIDVSV